MCARSAPSQFVAADRPPEPCLLHQLLPDGSFALIIPNGSPLAGSTSVDPVILELLDHCPAPLGELVRGLVWVRGHLRRATAIEVRPLLDVVAATNPNPILLDVGNGSQLLVLTVDSIIYADATGAEVVDNAGLLAARPDPFCEVEWPWLHHLEHHHPDMIERLRLRLPRGTRRGRIQLIGLDRYGVLVKTSGPQGDRHHRIPFSAPVADHASLSRALRILTAHPFSNALRTGNG
jgi:hypothetical protein